jgi:hypothetical protein
LDLCKSQVYHREGQENGYNHSITVEGRSLGLICLEELGREIASEMVCIGKEVDLPGSCGFRADSTQPHAMFSQSHSSSVCDQDKCFWNSDTPLDLFAL